MSFLENINCKKNEPLKINSHKLDEKNITKINLSLSSIDWQNKLKHRDVSEKFQSFHNTLIETIDQIAPEREMTISAKRVLKEPWMSHGLLKCCAKSRKLYLEFMKCRNNEHETRYKNYRNTLQRLKRYRKIVLS